MSYEVTYANRMSKSQGESSYKDTTRAKLEDDRKQHRKNRQLLYSAQSHLRMKDGRIKYLENLVEEIRERADGARKRSGNYRIELKHFSHV